MTALTRLSGHLGLRSPDGALLRHHASGRGVRAGVEALAAAGFGGMFDNFLSARPDGWVDELAAAARQCDLCVTSFVYDCEHWDGSGWVDGSALEVLPRMIDLARRSGARTATCTAAPCDHGSHDWQICEMARYLSRAADETYANDLTLCVEACHPDFAPGQLLQSFDEALTVVQLAAHRGVRLLLDVGHLALLGSDPSTCIARAAGWIGNVQFADLPGRVEPGAGMLDWAAVIDALEAAGYDGLFEIECEPAAPGHDGEQAMLRRLAALPGVSSA